MNAECFSSADGDDAGTDASVGHCTSDDIYTMTRHDGSDACQSEVFLFHCPRFLNSLFPSDAQRPVVGNVMSKG